ncbi:MAG TPA: hypothetical protein VGG48_01785 [Rhizomicrobium sp.]|jgi:hypothetical protein
MKKRNAPQEARSISFNVTRRGKVIIRFHNKQRVYATCGLDPESFVMLFADLVREARKNKKLYPKRRNDPLPFD